MAAIDEILLQKAEAHASRHRIKLGRKLGFGIHWQEWEKEKQEQFGPRWGMVRQVLSSLEAYEVFLVDVSPSNVAFLDEAGI